MPTNCSLSEFHVEFDQSLMLAMPIAGIVAWAAMGVFRVIFPERPVAMALFL